MTQAVTLKAATANCREQPEMLGSECHPHVCLLCDIEFQPAKLPELPSW
eukprot:CAMPEP_0181406588 /NCGR_PEP_ID=MMETSP1110-20121109/5349_1 /TAXON_ID=174948 /ORGANISM="Symbiodinium sp., Strain CCMP421" /LENGTH=48 /DNA_ID= /DNA_START= /DNA_END= /DNA_ORIENTATION=